MGDVFFTSDPHYGHVKVAELRGFPSVYEHDAALIKAYWQTVKPDDQVWFLGDLAASNPDAALGIISRLPGEKHLILGNHDKVHGMYRDAHKHFPKYLEVFASIQAFARRKIEGQVVLLSHFPYEADHTLPSRHTQFRLRNEGQFLLHGHIHSAEKYTSPIELHVGVDAWDMTPVPLSVVQEWVAARLLERHASRR